MPKVLLQFLVSTIVRRYCTKVGRFPQINPSNPRKIYIMCLDGLELEDNKQGITMYILIYEYLNRSLVIVKLD